MLDLNFEIVETNPFMIIPTTETLLMGALNHDPKNPVPRRDVIKYVEEVANKGTLSELFNYLMEKISESDFFKSLQGD